MQGIELRRFMLANFGFGDFVFKGADGQEVGRATDLRSLEAMLQAEPEASIAYHAERNHFSKWLKARTEFAVARKHRPPKVGDFATLEVSQQCTVVIAADEATAKEHLAKAGKVYGGHMGAALAEHGIWGTPERVIECIERHRALGCTLFVIEFFGRDTREPAWLFAETVLKHYASSAEEVDAGTELRFNFVLVRFTPPCDRM